MLDLLDQRLIERTRFTREEIQLRRRLRAAQRRRRRRMVETLLDSDVSGLRRDLRSLRLAGFTEREALGTRVLERVRADDLAATALLGSARRLGIDALHQLRRHVRRLRYLAEIAHDLFGLDEQVAADLKEVQERLGAVRDTWLLADWLKQTRVNAERQQEAELARAALGLLRFFRGRTRALYTVWRARPGSTVIVRCSRRLRSCVRASLPPPPAIARTSRPKALAPRPAARRR
jgi:CHAD domain-containing protein